MDESADLHKEISLKEGKQVENKWNKIFSFHNAWFSWKSSVTSYQQGILFFIEKISKLIFLKMTISREKTCFICFPKQTEQLLVKYSFLSNSRII